MRADNVTPFPGGNRFDVALRAARRRRAHDRGDRAADARPAQCPERARRDRGRRWRWACADAAIQTGFASFGGVKRRFTKVGEVAMDGGSVSVIDDYGHHPVEIRAVLAAAREGVEGRVIAVVPAAPLLRACAT